MEDILRSQIISIIASSTQPLTNPQIRSKLHQLGVTCVKYDINSKLHQMRNCGILDFLQQNGYNYWYLSSPTLIDDINNNNNNKCCSCAHHDAYEDYNYQQKLLEVRNLALNWKNTSDTHILPTRMNKISNFIRNNIDRSIGDVMLRKITFDIITHGW